MSDTKRYPILVSPKGQAAYSWLSKPDTKYLKAGKPVYKVSVLFPKTDVPPGRINFGQDVLAGKDWMKYILDICKEHNVGTTPGKGTCPFKDGDKQKDKEGNQKEDFAGHWFMTFNSTYKPELLDSKGHALPDSVPVYSGDIIKCAFAIKPVSTTKSVEDAEGNIKNVTVHYLATYLNKVMLIDKRTGSGDVEMGDEEGYEVSASEADGEDVDFGGEHVASTDGDY